jgi:hypothetical protein
MRYHSIILCHPFEFQHPKREVAFCIGNGVGDLSIVIQSDRVCVARLQVGGNGCVLRFKELMFGVQVLEHLKVVAHTPNDK